MDYTIAPVKAESLQAKTEYVLSEAHNFGLTVQRALGPKNLDGRGLEGRVLLVFSLAADGALMNARIAQSSGHRQLDSQVLEIVGRAAFPTPPVDLSVVHRTFVSAFTFT